MFVFINSKTSSQSISSRTIGPETNVNFFIALKLPSTNIVNISLRASFCIERSTSVSVSLPAHQIKLSQLPKSTGDGYGGPLLVQVAWSLSERPSPVPSEVVAADHHDGDDGRSISLSEYLFWF